MYFFHSAKKLVCSCVVSLGFCEQLAQALDGKWNSTIEGERGKKKNQHSINWKIFIWVVITLYYKLTCCEIQVGVIPKQSLILPETLNSKHRETPGLFPTYLWLHLFYQNMYVILGKPGSEPTYTRKDAIKSEFQVRESEELWPPFSSKVNTVSPSRQRWLKAVYYPVCVIKKSYWQHCGYAAFTVKRSPIVLLSVGISQRC